MMRNKLRTWKFTVAYPVLLWCLSVGLAYGASNGGVVRFASTLILGHVCPFPLFHRLLRPF